MQTSHRKIPGVGKNEEVLWSNSSVFARLFQAASAADMQRVSTNVTLIDALLGDGPGAVCQGL